MTDKIYDIAIIGGGPAGYSAALYAARAGYDTVVIEKMMGAGGQMTLTGDIDNYPGFDEGVDGFTLGMKMQAGAHKFGAETKCATVTGVELGGKIKKIKTAMGDLRAKAVIIATGANPRTLDIEGEQQLVGRGVHYCAHCDGRFYKGKTVVVVGGGNSAVGDALYLSKLCEKVILVHRRDKLRATKLYHGQIESCENIEVMWNCAVDSFCVDTRVNGVILKNLVDGSLFDVDCDGVFVSIGRKPVTEFLGSALETDSYGYIVADETTKTNVDGVFAAGDVRTKELRQVVTAAADGAVAVHYAEKYIEALEH
ncbi:MAG: thioredoxin-disulfide reductase [Ruminococcaceae bacterium]|nr:thioredoxin-disulfide reductase [Oscillospiraceae bacterium]